MELTATEPQFAVVIVVGERQAEGAHLAAKPIQGYRLRPNLGVGLVLRSAPADRRRVGDDDPRAHRCRAARDAQDVLDTGRRQRLVVQSTARVERRHPQAPRLQPRTEAVEFGDVGERRLVAGQPGRGDRVQRLVGARLEGAAVTSGEGAPRVGVGGDLERRIGSQGADRRNRQGHGAGRTEERASVDRGHGLPRLRHPMAQARTSYPA